MTGLVRMYSTTRCHPHPWNKIFVYKPGRKHEEIAEKQDVPPFIVYRFEEIFGNIEEVEALLSLKPGDILKAIRVNTLRASRDTLKRMLQDKGFEVEEYWIPYTLIVKYEPFSIGATHEYLKGYYYIQGPGSQTPVYITDPKPLELSIDLAAAPGGKTTQIAQHQRDTTPIIAVDKSRARLAALKNNANRLGVKSIIALAMDARETPKRLGLERFEYVLLDAPCTGEGLVPARHSSRKPEDYADRACLQIQLLESAVKLAKPGGRIVYVTCSIAPEENEYVVTRILEMLGDYVRVDRPQLMPPKALQGIVEFNGVHFDEDVKNCVRLYPHITSTEGFTICVLKKTASMV